MTTRHALLPAAAAASAVTAAVATVTRQAAPRQAAPRQGAQGADADPAARLQSLPPVIGPTTRLMVLGSFPGVASLRAQAYYAHPRNQFWPLLSALLDADFLGMPYRDRLSLLLERGLGLWDVYRQCRRVGSLDSAIHDAEFNDLASLRLRAPALCGVAHNGRESARALRFTAGLGLPVWTLPSSSPAHAGWSFARKLAAWREAFAAAGVLR